MITIGQFDHLTRGQQYTFVFALSGTTAQFGFTGDVNPVLRTLGNISQVNAVYNGGLWITTPKLYVTFIYTGSGSDTVNDLAGDMMDTLSANVSSIDLSTISLDSATMGDVIKNPDEMVKEKLGPFVPTQGTLILVVVGLAIVAFLASGGAGLVRRAAS